ncbi:MAG: zinc-ribbon domain-containing protein [Clostridia bacterium]|nr:zinc-ribbon domain-containing protein [Clostridia bacterium]
MLCKNCGAELGEGMKFCSVCAAPVEEQTALANVQSQTIADGTAAAQLPVAANTAPASESKPKKGKVILIIAIVAVLLIGAVAALFATGVLDFDKVTGGVFKTYTVVGEWEMAYGDDVRTVFEIDEDYNLTFDGMDEDMELAESFGMTYKYYYDEEKSSIIIAAEIYGLSYNFKMPCELCEDFLIITLPEVLTEMLSDADVEIDPIILRRVGTDGDPIEFFKEKFGKDEYMWDPEKEDAFSSFESILGF